MQEKGSLSSKGKEYITKYWTDKHLLHTVKNKIMLETPILYLMWIERWLKSWYLLNITFVKVAVAYNTE